jgi:hypothetical protein
MTYKEQFKERWTIYNGKDLIPYRLYFETLTHTPDKINIVLSDENEQVFVSINFKDFFSYRCNDEGNLLKTLNEIEGLSESPFFVVENSNYLKWFHSESLGVRLDQHLKHYAIVTPHEVIDILSTTAPQIKIFSHSPIEEEKCDL